MKKKFIICLIIVLLAIGTLVFVLQFNFTDRTTAILSDIPLSGDVDSFNLSAENALAYAQAISDASLSLDAWGNFDFDMMRIALLDISGDGVPLLLLVEEDDSISWGTAHWNILFGVSNGQLLQITEHPIGLGAAEIQGETLLVLMIENDWGSKYSFFRIENGTAEPVFEIDFFANRLYGTFYINGQQVEEEYYHSAKEDFQIERFLETSHPGTVHVTPAFDEKLSYVMTREQAVQLFLNHARAME